MLLPDHDCIHQDDFKTLYQKVESSSEQMNRIESDVSAIKAIVTEKTDRDKDRNGRIKEIGDKTEAEDKAIITRVRELEKQSARHEVAMTDIKETQQTIISLLKALIVSLAAFLIIFLIKTTVLGI